MTEAAESAPVWNRRGPVALGCASLCLVITLAYAGQSWPIVLYRLLTDGFLAIVWIVAAYGIGSLVPLPDRSEQFRAFRVVTRIAIGLGVTSLLALGLGMAGALNRATALAMLGIGLAACIWSAFRNRAAIEAAAREWWNVRAGWAWLWAAATPFLAMSLVAALVPPGILWGDEPNGYDVVEYHLQVPREWFEAGRITPLNHNVFSYFPFNVEMQFLLAMHVRGGPWAGMYLAQLMHVGYVALVVAAVWAAARAVGGDRASATVAAVAAAATPWLALLAPVAYNEGGLLLYGTLAVAWTLIALRDAERRIASMAVAGAMAGLACGVKLTGVPMLLLPLPAVLVAIAAVRREPIGRALAAAVVFGVVGVATFGPWLARNVAWAGNPVFPEGQSVFGRGHFTEAQGQRWKTAHAPREDQRGIGARLSVAATQIVIDARYGFVLFPLALVAAALSRRSPQAWLLLAMLAVFTIVWLGFTHLQGRFFVLAIPVAALLVAQAQGRGAATGAAVVSVVLAVTGWVVMHRRMTLYLHEKGVAQVLGVEPIGQFMTPAVANDVPADATLALAGDAKAFCYQRPMSRLRYRTVFDVQGGEDWLNAWVPQPRPDRVTILVDPGELSRFAKTYSGLPVVPGDVLERGESFLIDPSGR